MEPSIRASKRLSPGFPRSASLVLHSLLLLPAACVHTSGLQGSLTWPLPRQTLLSPPFSLCYQYPHSFTLLLQVSPFIPPPPADPRLSFRPPRIFPSGLHTGPAPPEAGAGPSALPNPPTPLSTGSSLPPPRAFSVASRPGPARLAPAQGSTSPRRLAPSPPRPLHLQLRLGRPRLRSRRDPHLPPSPGLIGRCLTTDPHNKTSAQSPSFLTPSTNQPSRALHLPSGMTNRSRRFCRPLLSARPLFLNWTNHEEGEFKSRP